MLGVCWFRSELRRSFACLIIRGATGFGVSPQQGTFRTSKIEKPVY